MTLHAHAQKSLPVETVENDTISADFEVIIDNKDMWRIVQVQFLAHKRAALQREFSRRAPSPVAATNGYKSHRRRH